MQIDSQLLPNVDGFFGRNAVAIVRAFFDYYEQPLGRPEPLALADVEEQITHRSPSGLDAATVSSKPHSITSKVTQAQPSDEPPGDDGNRRYWS
ncbi:MAG: hypothetical protein ACLSH6_07000 [Limosilactobacillus pontis]